ncbi:hypothetical protein AVEN_170753-1 [Araneus ventricosus]|uniref:Uncharacterized protein n=1 Tax=Araneus ventricosus TaxID=182803 RepID=A0A4Y2N9V5_ARAVE|nr:hypothetical protein AVEN_170753-1 [Araneus ventricosus]
MKVVEIGPVVEAGVYPMVLLLQNTYPLHILLGKTEENVQWRSIFSASLVNERWEATTDDIARRHQLLYEIKIVDIGLVVGAVGLVLWFCQLF